MKRFVVFKFDQYYPSGGWNDFTGSFDTVEEARASIVERSHFDHAQILDSQEFKVVEEF